MTAVHHRQQGAALIVALVMLLLITLLATSSLRDSTLHNRLSGTLAERQHASNAADSALNEGERRVKAMAMAGDPYGGAADCHTSIADEASITSNLCILVGDPMADPLAAGTDWWTANTTATDYTGSDGASSFAVSPRWNAAAIDGDESGSSKDVTEEVGNQGKFYYRVSAQAKADGERFPVIHQSVYRISVP